MFWKIHLMVNFYLALSKKTQLMHLSNALYFTLWILISWLFHKIDDLTGQSQSGFYQLFNSFMKEVAIV